MAQIKYQVCARTDDETRTYGPFEEVEVHSDVVYVLSPNEVTPVMLARMLSMRAKWLFFESENDNNPFSCPEWSVVAVVQPEAA